MAYSTGAGNNLQDLMDAVRGFALGLGWTIDVWSTADQRLYLSKGVCKAAWQWGSTNWTEYLLDGNTAIIADGWVRGTLSSGPLTNVEPSSLPGAAGPRAGYFYGFCGTNDLTGPYIGWHLFSDAAGNYIHVTVQTAADRYAHFGFGVGDNLGLSHSGVAYMYGDGARYYWRHKSLSTPTSDYNLDYNDAGIIGPMFSYTSGPYAYNSYFQAYTENGLPAGFTNSVAIPSYGSSSYENTSQRAVPLMTATSDLSSEDEYPSILGPGPRLLDAVIGNPPGGHSPYAPMAGFPLIVADESAINKCALGAVPDLRMINMTGITARQELALGLDTWVIFPKKRQANWSDSKTAEAVTSGQFGLALKKIL